MECRFSSVKAHILNESGSEAQSEVCPTGDQAVAGSIPAPVWQHSFVKIDHKNVFYGHSLPSTDSRRAVTGKRMCTWYW